MENKDIIAKIKEQAYENVNRKIEEERKKTENKIDKELDDVNKCIELINQKMIFKKKKNSYSYNYVLATTDMFFEDYSKENTSWNRGIKFPERKYKYMPYFTVNGEDYYDVRFIIGAYEEDVSNLKRRSENLWRTINEIESEMNDMIKEQHQVKKLLQEYQELNVIQEDDEE